MESSHSSSPTSTGGSSPTSTRQTSPTSTGATSPASRGVTSTNFCTTGDSSIMLAGSLRSVRLQDVDNQDAEPYCEIRSSPGKGKGLFSTRTIQAGTLIFSEEPLIRLSRRDEDSHEAIRDAYLNLCKRDQRLYQTLHDADKSRMSAVVSIYYSNCYSTDNFVTPGAEESIDEGGSCIGALASRINHSCLPNVCFSYLPPSEDRPRGLMSFHAITKISKSKELLSNYSKNIFQVAAKRQLENKQHYGFDCCCGPCAGLGTFWMRGDERRKAMKRAVEQLKILESGWNKQASSENRDQAEEFRLCQEAIAQLSYLEEALIKEGLKYTPLANVYRSLAKWATRSGGSPRCWLEKENNICVLMSGSSSLRSQAVDRALRT